MTKRKHLVVFSGAGVSADSGVSTFRDGDGLWEKHRVEDICTADAWRRNQQLVLEFYNARRKQLFEVEPNNAHKWIVEAEKYFDVTVITQNVDNLHERAGSKKVVHLHGELVKCRSSVNPNLIYNVDGWEMKLGEKCEEGSQLRPFIVFFGEDVPMYDKALEIVTSADILLIVGTSLQVYPAAGLIHYAPSKSPIYVVDPKCSNISTPNPIFYEQSKAKDGVEKIIQQLINEL